MPELKHPATAHQAKMLARYHEIQAQRDKAIWDDGTSPAPWTPSDRALIYRLRKLGLIKTVEQERTERREREEAHKDAPKWNLPSARTLRRYVPKNGRPYIPAAQWKEWLAKQPPEVQEEQREIYEFNLLFQKWQAFINAWNRAPGSRQHHLAECFDLVREIHRGCKEGAPAIT